MSKQLYIVEIWDDSSNYFVVHSKHRNEDHALINFEVVAKSKKVHTRVIYKGLIIASSLGTKHGF